MRIPLVCEHSCKINAISFVPVGRRKSREETLSYFFTHYCYFCAYVPKKWQKRLEITNDLVRKCNERKSVKNYIIRKWNATPRFSSLPHILQGKKNT